MKYKSQLMTSDDVQRALKRISHQIAEHNSGTDNVVVIGIRKGGVPLAARLAENLHNIEGQTVPVGALDISGHRDDVDQVPTDSSTDIPFDITGKDVVLVDDVLYTGRTARAALDASLELGRASTVQLAVLVDRGHRELPIRADYVGKNIPTSRTEKVDVEQDEAGETVVNIYDL